MNRTPRKNAASPQGRLADHMGRRYLLDVSANGVVTIRDSRGVEGPNGSLPVFSTKTLAMAEALQVRHCRLARNKSGLYYLNEFDDGNVEDLVRVGTMFAEDYNRILARRKTERLARQKA
jgi:hypothetical protein